MTNSERVLEDIKNAVHDAEAILGSQAAGASEKARAARESLLTAIESAKACCGDLEAKAAAGAKAADKLVRGHPYQAIGIALGVGVLVGCLIHRK